MRDALLLRSTAAGNAPARSPRAPRVFRSVHLDDCSRFFLLRTLRRDNTNDTSMQDGMENPT
ncbi:hypothetical protein NUV26_20790 [Burkholderia pseudomultivorans]|uniref:hypothetical protein n=1 Tax=Burkholderia pseudomultivorans TaxID=1207504 RepID=UPI0001FD7C2B|nr:hypothetical protein [Burkholderia pseudomultivorans]EGD02909.1 hypothetical protein B1M_19122 [Burkholderia sp. TJI49]AOI92520.1 hypothetical protein WS57_28000 [Burkholderia pseudomultivorans]KVC35556.1 hypothetical protein WS56_08525 [Burkholderia pseudomultivorans]KVC38530.1 hypothetical protein WS55_27510 [Burkholderia pseudomultivorans]KVC49430.1 hypothetical protein WS58_07675 [Burkholderia pseudomultivorans]